MSKLETNVSSLNIEGTFLTNFKEIWKFYILLIDMSDFLKILASNYGPGPLIIWKNTLS